MPLWDKPSISAVKCAMPSGINPEGRCDKAYAFSNMYSNSIGIFRGVHFFTRALKRYKLFLDESTTTHNRVTDNRRLRPQGFN